MSSELHRASLYFRFIREEHNHQCQIFEKGRSQILDALKHVKVDPNRPQPTPQQQAQGHVPPPAPKKEEENKVDISSDVKKLYRKIVQETHPDKMINAQHSLKEIEKRKEMYVKAVEAFKLGDENILIEVAVDLEIPLEFDDDRIVKALTERSRSLESDIARIKGTPEWYWIHASEEEKIRVIKEICVRNGWLYVTDEQIIESVRYVLGVHPGSREDVRQRARQRIQSRNQLN